MNNDKKKLDKDRNEDDLLKPIESLNEEVETEDEDSEEPALIPQGLHGEEELDEIYSQRGGADFEAEEQGSPAPKAPERSREVSAQPDRRGRSKNVKDLILGEVRDRAQRANDRLRSQLNGLLSIEVTEPKSSYSLSLKADKLELTEKPSEQSAKADCTIHIRQGDLLRIADGELNPQVGMLSDRIKVEGRLGLAVYFFNLVAPQ